MKDISYQDHRGEDFFMADFSNANLSHANLAETNFTEADLSLSNLNSADLSRADLTNATVSQASFKNTILYGANLESTRKLTQEQLAEALGDEDTKIPEDMKRPSSWEAEEEY